ncbi:MAG: acyltransferase [Phycisphaerae bacterium]|nr:acyltransferase [Phycisphaerae bacterium]NUQ47252.1 acyltransferase [Phycisphaerae bacterium]
MPDFDIFRRALGRVIRWALRPPFKPFAARGRNVVIIEPCTINYPERMFFGDDIYIGPNASFNSVGGIRIGSGTIFGPFVHVYSGNHRYEEAEALPFDEHEYLRPVDIGANVWIGGDVVILPGVTIGEGAVVAGGAVVLNDVPAGAVVGGFPAKQLKQRDMEHYARLKREGKILNALVGAGKNRPKPIGEVPRQWYVDAGQRPPE